MEMQVNQDRSTTHLSSIDLSHPNPISPHGECKGTGNTG